MRSTDADNLPAIGAEADMVRASDRSGLCAEPERTTPEDSLIRTNALCPRHAGKKPQREKRR